MARTSVKNESPIEEVGAGIEIKQEITQAEEKSSAPTKVGNVAAKEEQRAYCGPEMKGVANQNAIFIGELPEPLKEAAEKCKAIQKLIVPIEKFPATLAAVSTLGTPENAFFRKATEYARGGK